MISATAVYPASLPDGWIRPIWEWSAIEAVLVVLVCWNKAESRDETVGIAGSTAEVVSVAKIGKEPASKVGSDLARRGWKTLARKLMESMRCGGRGNHKANQDQENAGNCWREKCQRAIAFPAAPPKEEVNKQGERENIQKPGKPRNNRLKDAVDRTIYRI